MIETRTQWSKACSARKSLNQAQQRYEQSAAWLDTVDAAGRLAGEASNAKQSLTAIESEMPAAVAIIASLEGQLSAAQQAEQAAASELTKAIQDRIAVARDAVTAKETELAAANTTTTEKFKSIEHEASRQLATAALQPLTPEQLCWSTLRVTGVLDAYMRTEAAELEKATPLAVDADATTKALRHRQALRQAFDKLRGHADAFVSLYASGPDKTEDDFFASADQALFTANAGSVYAWAGPGNDNVTQKAIAMTDNAQIAQMMYWTLLCRPPTAEESQLISEQIVASGENRNAVIQEMVWGLLASVEFRFVN